MKIIKRFCVVIISALFVLLICGCQDSNTVSKAEYDEIVAERDMYKELYENAINGEQEPASEETELVVDLTMDNIGDYFEFMLVTDSVDFSEGQPATRCVIKSKLYEDGWIYLDSSKDFKIEVRVAPDIGPGGGRNPFAYYDDLIKVSTASFDVDEFTLKSVSGRVRFAHKSVVSEYIWDDFKLVRKVTLSDGTVFGSPIWNSAQADYPL